MATASKQTPRRTRAKTRTTGVAKAGAKEGAPAATHSNVSKTAGPTGADRKKNARSPAPSAAQAKPLELVITGPKRGRWRAGMHFTAQPTTLSYDALSEQARQALIDDPSLTVVTREAD